MQNNYNAELRSYLTVSTALCQLFSQVIIRKEFLGIFENNRNLCRSVGGDAKSTPACSTDSNIITKAQTMKFSSSS